MPTPPARRSPRALAPAGVALSAVLLAGCGGTTTAATTGTAPIARPPSAEVEFAAAVESVIPVDDAAIIVGEGACELFEIGRTRQQVLDAVSKLRHVDASGNLLPLDTSQVPLVVDTATLHLCPEDEDSGGVHGGGSHPTAHSTPRTSSARPSRTPDRSTPSRAPRTPAPRSPR